MIEKGKIKIEETDDTPLVEFDIEKNILRIAGPSFPENAPDFYNPIIAEVCNIDPQSPGQLVIELEFPSSVPPQTRWCTRCLSNWRKFSTSASL